MMNLHSIPLEVIPQRLFWSNEPHTDCRANGDPYGHYWCAITAWGYNTVVYTCEHRCNEIGIHDSIHYFAHTGGNGFCDRCRNNNCPY